jgi:hypothetical protein
MNTLLSILSVAVLLLPLHARGQSAERGDAFTLPSTLRFQAQGYAVAADGEHRSFTQAFRPAGLAPADDGKPYRSPVLAGAMSLAIPGAGEFYAQSYLLGAGFLALEGLGWYFNIRYNQRGDDATTNFERFADTHWSAVRYAQWLNVYAKNFEGSDDRLIQISIDLTTPGLQDWQRVDWGTMNKVESAIPVFSHRLPLHGEQQYFELIGKYHQYSYGWDDKLPTGDGYSDYRNISDRFKDYSYQRGHANDLYNTATTIASLIVVNHILSAADAAWAAVRFNKHVDFHTRFFPRERQDGSIELIPTASFAWTF